VEVVRLGGLRSVREFRDVSRRVGVDIPVADQAGPALSSPVGLFGRTLRNRFTVQPMEGWDGTREGEPTEFTRRRWRRFGSSGAALVWGGEAVAVSRDGRANPNQLCIGPGCERWLSMLRQDVLDGRETAGELVIGLQLTHSGRWSRPDGEPRPIIAFHDPVLDARAGVDESHEPVSDERLRTLIDDMVAAAVHARNAGFDFVDVKHCHGYLLHELLTADARPGGFGGSFENRTRVLREVVSGIRAEAPGLGIGVRLSAWDEVPFRPGSDGVGVPETQNAPRFGVGRFAGEEVGFLRLCSRLGVPIVNITAGSPYYCPHVQRPAQYPPSDAYLPPEDPLAGVARQMHIVRRLRREVPEVLYVGSAYSYLQEFVPNVAEAAVRDGWTDFVGLGRMMLSYPQMPRDVLEGRPLRRKSICRTLSDCTTAPRHGMVSGCYPLDPHYRSLPERARLEQIKRSR
jgi:NADPH2 dehydrogenase